MNDLIKLCNAQRKMIKSLNDELSRFKVEYNTLALENEGMRNELKERRHYELQEAFHASGLIK